ncbi:MAG: TonB-dependent receptor [Pseudomonadales bacterium]|jgi:outer membrane receptor protein involved in Fe transport|nr:TonB-dependent receptor [Pseudomonadales bacterium]
MQATTQNHRRTRLFTAVNRSICKLIKPAGLAALAFTSITPLAHAQQAVEEIQVTGSRIARSTMETPTPVTTIEGSELAAMAPGSLINGLAQLPQFYNNQTPDQSNGGQNSGGSNINLRGAGANRTLVLLDGRRVVPSNRFGAVDVALFPTELLRSVETVTGGASASYGTDAVAGVVNFLLNTKYEGFKTHVQGGLSERNDGGTWEGGFAFGKNFDDGFHLMGSMEMSKQEPIWSLGSMQDREYINLSARITNPAGLTPAGGGLPSGPTDIIRPFVRPTNFSNTGVMIANNNPALNRLEFQPDGTVKPLPFNGVGSLTSGCLCYADPANGYGVNSDNDLYAGYERQNLFLYANQEFGNNTNVYAQMIAGRNLNRDRRESISLLSGWEGRIYADNAFLRPEVSKLMTDNNAQFVGYGFFAPNVVDTPLGESRQDTKNRAFSLTVGLDHDFTGGFFDGWNLKTHFQHGEAIQDFLTINGVRVDRMQFAMDAVRDPATGQIVCRVNLPQFTGPISQGGNGGYFSDCVPMNTFGGVQNISKAAADYIMDRDNKDARQWTWQDSFEFVMSGELAKGWAGPLDSAFGVSWRKEKFDQRTLDLSDEFPALVDGTLLSDLGLVPEGIRGVIPQGQPGGIPGLRFVPAGYLGDANSSSVLFSSLRAFGGSYDVKEAFAELNVPLLKGVTLIDSLDSSWAVRWADYEGSGSIWAWKFGLNWTVNDQIRLRATQSRDVRAGSLRERYDQTRGGINVRNPWDGGNLVSAASLAGGNPNVNPEKADTLTAGIVYQPKWFEGFQTSLDYYYIDISDAIASLGSQTIVDSCRLGDVSLCQYVITPTGPVTNPTTNDFRQIDRVESLFINLANQRIKGADWEMRYRTDVNFFGGEAERLSWRLLYSWLGENSRQNPGAVRDDSAGSGQLAQNKITTSINYSYGTFSTFLQARWTDSTLLDRTYLESQVAVPASAKPVGSVLALCNGGTVVCTIDRNKIPSFTYWDARFAKTFGPADNLELFFNINNLTDKTPGLSPGAIGRTGVGVGVGGQFDIVGRRYTLGARYQF